MKRPNISCKNDGKSFDELKFSSSVSKEEAAGGTTTSPPTIEEVEIPPDARVDPLHPNPALNPLLNPLLCLQRPRPPVTLKVDNTGTTHAEEYEAYVSPDAERPIVESTRFGALTAPGGSLQSRRDEGLAYSMGRPHGLSLGYNLFHTPPPPLESDGKQHGHEALLVDPSTLQIQWDPALLYQIRLDEQAAAKEEERSGGRRSAPEEGLALSWARSKSSGLIDPKPPPAAGRAAAGQVAAAAGQVAAAAAATRRLTARVCSRSSATCEKKGGSARSVKRC